MLVNKWRFYSKYQCGITLTGTKKGRIATFSLLIVCVTPNFLSKVQELLMQLTRAGRLKLLNSYQTRK